MKILILISILVLQIKTIKSEPNYPLLLGTIKIIEEYSIYNYKNFEVKIEPFKIIGISVRTTNENNQAAKEIADLWGEFMGGNVLGAIPNRIDNIVYSIYTDYESDHTKPYTAILGCKVSNLNSIPDGMIGKSFDGGNYVKLSAKRDLIRG